MINIFHIIIMTYRTGVQRRSPAKGKVIRNGSRNHRLEGLFPRQCRNRRVHPLQRQSGGV